MQARFYAPWYGRFLSPDPGRDQHFEDTQSWNIYSYVRNQPTMFGDPTGMEKPMSEQERKQQETAQKATNTQGFHAGEKAVVKELLNKPIVPHSFGVTGTAQAEAGVGIPGAALQGSVSKMVFIDDAGKTETGTVVSRNVGTAVGASAAVGSAFTVSNARSTKDMDGSSMFLSGNAGIGPIKGSFSFTLSDTGTYTFSLGIPVVTPGLTTPSASLAGGVSTTIWSSDSTKKHETTPTPSL